MDMNGNGKPCSRHPIQVGTEGSRTVRRVGVLTGGGDAPGLNAVIRAVVEALCSEGVEVLGFLDGFQGLVEDQYEALSCSDVDSILSVGGTILGTTNRGSFTPGQENDADALRAVEAYRRHQLECLVCIGGDGTMAIAQRLSTRGMAIVGIPKTIDNDLLTTDQTFGFDSAVSVVTECLDRLHTTAASHRRVIVVEVMGRNAGWIALHSGVAGGAGVILLPEIRWEWDPIVRHVQALMARRGGHVLVVVAEGAAPPGGAQVLLEAARLGGIGKLVADELQRRAGVECRVSVLGHIQRGGSPTATDRILGSKFGVFAAGLVLRKDYGKMVALKGTQIECVEIPENIGVQRVVVPETDQTVFTARQVGICFGNPL